MNRKLVPLAAAVMLVLGGCGGGGGGSSSSSTSSDNLLSGLVSGIEVPSEISAVPADQTGTVAKPTGFASAVMMLAATVDQNSDYVMEKPSVYVEEHALEQFDIIETVFKAVAQTHYADQENVTTLDNPVGAYQAVISWEENQSGKDVKTMETWTVKSSMVNMTLPSDVTGNTTGNVNKLEAWIPEIDRQSGQEQLIKAEFLIYTAPNRAADGSLVDYGEWDMNVLMGADSTGVDTVSGTPANFFAASARVASNGSSVLKVHDAHTEMQDFGSGPVALSGELKGILFRNGTDGYGQVSYPDWDSCWQGIDFTSGGTSPCQSGTIPTNVAKYAYNTNYLGVQEVNNGVDGAAVYKDRNLSGAINVVHRYGLYYANAGTDANGVSYLAGDSVLKHVNFGFPVTFQNTASDGSGTTFNDHAFYGAWQGRHQLWGSGNYPVGAVFNRQDVPPGQTAPTYTLKEFNGTFTKRTLTTASLNDVLSIPVEVWLNDHYDMFYTGTDWQYCDGGYIDWSGTSPVCRDKSTNSIVSFTAFTGSTLATKIAWSANDRRYINVGTNTSCGPNGCMSYVYLTSDPQISSFTSYSTPGFYQATMDNNTGQLTPSGSLLSSTSGDNMWIDIGGSVYVAYVGFDSTAVPEAAYTTTGWVQKKLLSFDQNTWTPTFDVASSDTEFTPDRGMQYYMNAKGQNYVVTRTDAGGATAFEPGDYEVKLELQTAANPVNTNSTASATILPVGTSYLGQPWDTTHSLKLKLVSDPTSVDYLLLEVVSDSTGTYTANQLYTEASWGLVAFNSSDKPLAVDGTVLTTDPYGWVDPSLNGGLEPVQFNYEYAGNGNDWGKQQFLVYASNPPTGYAVGDYVILSDPITLNNVALYDNLGAATGETVSLQFDGWMHGLPDMYQELQKNNWSIAGLGDKVRLLVPSGSTDVILSDGTTSYIARPMETSLFLGIVTAFPLTPSQPDITQADSGVDLSTVPTYTPHNMGAVPTTDGSGNAIQVKYSEGKTVQ